jgi:hypothetical protein
MISFIWMGKLDTMTHVKLCQLGPKSLAARLPMGEVITMWVTDSLINQAKGLFSDCPNIEVKSVNAMLRGEYGELAHIGHNVKNIENLFDQMQATESFAAQKDLMSFVTMSEYGGYYFDCTTSFEGSVNLPEISDFKITLGKHWQVWEEGLQPFFWTDIWTFAATPGHPLFLKTLDINLNYYCRVSEPFVWNNSRTGEFAGSIVNALVQLYGSSLSNATPAEHNAANEWLKQRSFTVDTNVEYGQAITELGLTKYSTGLWRRKQGELPNEIHNNLNWNAFNKLGLIEDSSSVELVDQKESEGKSTAQCLNQFETIDPADLNTTQTTDFEKQTINFPEDETSSSSTTSISMMVLGGFIIAAGITAVAIAFTLLNATTFGVAGLVVAGAGVGAALSGIGLFATGTHNKSGTADANETVNPSFKTCIVS